MSDSAAILGLDESWSREALSERTGGCDGELVAESLDFIHSCVSATPLLGYASLFDRERAVADEGLRESLLDALASFRSDLARWQLDFASGRELIDALRLAPTLQATFFYRISRALFLRRVELLPDVIANLSRQLTGVEIYYSAAVGPGLKLIHGHGTVIGAMCQVGSQCTVYQNVTIGDKLGRDTGKRPAVGDYVILCAGAQVFGPVTVGARTIVGANSVVLDSVSGSCVVAGAPARQVGSLSEQEFQEFWTSIKG